MPPKIVMVPSIGLLLFLTACGTCEEAAQDADAFVRQSQNQICVADNDCVVVTSNCSPMETTYCGQVSMSASAANSDEWKVIQDELDACDQHCTVCLADLTPSCQAGYCRPPE